MITIRKNRKLSKSIFLFTIVTVLLNTTLQTEAAVGDAWRRVGTTIKETLREKLPGLVKKTTSSVKYGAVSAYQKVKGFDKRVLIDKLLENITKLGGQIGKIKDCMLFGFQCSSSERAAFYATALTILALTAAVVGFTITVAATSKKSDTELNKAIEATSQEAQGWSPNAVFQRLNTKLASFKQRLLSMRACLTSRKCSRQQKRELYATAATVVALVTVAIGVGVGSYIYAEHKKKQEIAELPGEQIPTTEEVPAVSPEKEGFRPTLTFDESPLKEGRLTKFQQLFRSKIEVTKAKAHELQTAYQQVKEQVRKGVIRTKEAAANKFLELVEKAKDFPALVQEVLQVNLGKFREAAQNAKAELAILKQSMSEKGLTFSLGSFRAQVDTFKKYLQSLTDKIAFVTSGLTKTQALKRYIDVARKAPGIFEKKIRELEAKQNGASAEEIEKAKRKLEVSILIRNRAEIYPTIVKKINELELYRVGDFANRVLHGLVRLLAAAQALHKTAGKIGLVISPDRIQEGLWEMQYGISSVGITLQKALRNKPLIVTNIVKATDLVKSLVEAAMTTARFGFLRENFGKFRAINRSLGDLSKTTEKIEQEAAAFSERMERIQQEAREKFITTIRKNPLRAIPHAAVLLRNTLEEAVEKARNSFDALMKKSMATLTMVKDVAPLLFVVFQSLNDYIQQATKQPFINQQLLKDLTPILTNSVPNIAEGAKRLVTSVGATPAA